MKTLKYFLCICFAAQLLTAQSNITFSGGSSIDVGLGADICADHITASITGDGTQCGLPLLKVLTLFALIEGFYNGTTMVSDTVTVQFRNSVSPYNLVEQKKLVLNSSGAGSSSLTTVLNGTSYYLVVKHRNSIETWSGTGKSFTSNQLSYDFTTASSQAYGNNMKLKSGKWCIYSGDVNASGTINVTDINTVYTASNAGLTGYVKTDVNGSNTVNVTDINITYANSNLGVSVQKPTVFSTEKAIDPIVKINKEEK